MDQNVTNFAKANELPMRFVPWSFIIPGIILVVLSLVLLVIPSKKKAA